MLTDAMLTELTSAQLNRLEKIGTRDSKQGAQPGDLCETKVIAWDRKKRGPKLVSSSGKCVVITPRGDPTPVAF